MAKQTNLLLSVPEDVYYNLVEPMKKAKCFTKLVVTLLTGYMSDKYIHDYADDTLAEGRRATFEAFNNSISEAESILARMGMIGEEIQSTAEAGSVEFTKKREQTIEDMNSRGFGEMGNGQEPANTEEGTTGVSVNDFETLTKRVDGLENVISQNFERLFGILSTYGEPAVKSSPSPIQVKSEGSNSVSKKAADAVAQAVQSINPGSEEQGSPETALVVGENFLDDVFSGIGFQTN